MVQPNEENKGRDAEEEEEAIGSKGEAVLHTETAAKSSEQGEKCLNFSEAFTPSSVISLFPQLQCVIDLTNTKR